MEPAIASASVQVTQSNSEQSEDGFHTNDATEQHAESFEATIVRLDQAAAEQLFRAAKL